MLFISTLSLLAYVFVTTTLANAGQCNFSEIGLILSEAEGFIPDGLQLNLDANANDAVFDIPSDTQSIKFKCEDKYFPRSGEYRCTEGGSWVIQPHPELNQRTDIFIPCRRSSCNVLDLHLRSVPDEVTHVSDRFYSSKTSYNYTYNDVITGRDAVDINDWVFVSCKHGVEDISYQRKWAVHCTPHGWEKSENQKQCIKACKNLHSLLTSLVVEGQSESDRQLTLVSEPRAGASSSMTADQPRRSINDEYDEDVVLRHRDGNVVTSFSQMQQVYLPGSKAFFDCRGDDYYLVDDGDREITCLSDGQWSFESYSRDQLPTCRQKKKCRRPDDVTGRFIAQSRENDFETDPGREEYTDGAELVFSCSQSYAMDGDGAVKCLPSGYWSHPLPTCVVQRMFSMKRFIVLVAVISLLLLILLILSVFLIQRQLWLRKMARVGGRHRLVDPPSIANLPGIVSSIPHAGSPGGSNPAMNTPAGIAPPAYPGAGAAELQQDRLALIAFADGIDPPLPSYEDAIRPPAALDAISTLSGYASRLGRRLPSLSSLRSRDIFAPIRPLRESTGPSAHSSHAGISNAIQESSGGSCSTVGAMSEGLTASSSDGSSGRTSGSTRANAGSISGSCSSLHRQPDAVSANTDGEPLLEESGNSEEEKSGSEC